MDLNIDENSTKSKKLKDGKILSADLNKEIIQNIIPHKVQWSFFSSFLNSSNKNRTVRCDSLIISYAPYIQNISGSIIINLYDSRHENPRNRLLLHTSFPASEDQYIAIHPNVVYSGDNIEDSLMLEIFSKDLELKTSSTYAYIKVKCGFSSSSKRMKGDVPSLEGVPGLYYTRGDLLNAEEISKLTRQHGFVGPPLTSGNDYVIKGAGAVSKIQKEFKADVTGSKYTQKRTYEDKNIEL
nr:TPA_asm: P3 [Lycium betacytorhabdovirus 1]